MVQKNLMHVFTHIIDIDALLIKQMLKKQTGFVLLPEQNKSDLVILHQNQNKSNMF